MDQKGRRRGRRAIKELDYGEIFAVCSHPPAVLEIGSLFL